MALDTVDILHNAEDRIGVLEATLGRLLAAITTARTMGVPVHQVAGFTDAVDDAAFRLAEGYRRPCNPCAECDGTGVRYGEMSEEYTCSECDGTGEERDDD